MAGRVDVCRSDSVLERFPRTRCGGSVLTDDVFAVELACAPNFAKGFAAGGGVAFAGLILTLGLAVGSVDGASCLGVPDREEETGAEASAPVLGVVSELEDAAPDNFSMRRRRIYGDE